MKKFKIIDLFAGPGGLGEGFSAYSKNGVKPFKIAVSIEKDAFAHKTLTLRSFFRQFRDVPKEYYQYLQNKICREELLNLYPDEAQAAYDEAWLAELGSPEFPHETVVEKIKSCLTAEEECILIGGPPCQAYSLAGRSAMNKKENFEDDPRHTLYREYLKIIAEFKPAVFVMENVKGILSSKLDGEFIFDKILEDLRIPQKGNSKENETYTIFSLVTDKMPEDLNKKDFIIKAEDYGIPQARHRVILLGIRNDIKSVPSPLRKVEEKVSVKDAIGDLPKLRSGLSKLEDSYCNWVAEIRKFNNRADVYPNLSRGAEFISQNANPCFYKEWFYDSKIKGVVNHETRGHMSSDLHRYYYIATYASKERVSPRLDKLPLELLPQHKNVKQAIRSKSLFSDRFKVQMDFKPATTITSHISKDGHYFIHYDPMQCRSLTVREAARLQTFPDNYKFEGPRTAQYHQVGNAVPPLLAKQIAEIVYKLLDVECNGVTKINK
ncbi:MAG: DNA cytosine methyltransferase [Alphaproteobacteria bacterium]